MNQSIKSLLASLFFPSTLLVLVGLFYVLLPFIRNGFPETHDGANHLVRFANYKLALQQGQLPPRFAPNLFQGYGYPVFNYNYPLANMLSIPLAALDISYETTFKLLVASFLVFGLVGIHFWLELLFNSRKGVFIAQLAWLLNPYLITSLYIRGSIGEVIAYCLLPWLFYIIESANSTRFSPRKLALLSVVGASFLLSHNITVVFFSVIAFLYSGVRVQNNLKAWKQLFLIALLSTLLSLWFWLPALLEMNLTAVSDTSLTADYTGHLLTFAQLGSPVISKGFSEIGTVDGLVVGAGSISLLAVLLYCVILVVTNLLKLDGDVGVNRFLAFWISVVTLLLLQTTYSTPVWSTATFLKFIQFPWRLGIFVAVISLPLVVFIWQQRAYFLRLLLVVTLTFQAIQTISNYPSQYFHWTNEEYEQMNHSTTTKNENKPNSFKYDLTEPRINEPEILQGSAEVTTVSNWNGSSRTFSLTLLSDSILVEPTMYFPGWETVVTDANGNTHKLSYIDNNVIKGRIAYHLDQGQYSVRTRFTQNTWPRITGNAVSVLSLVFILWFAIVNKEKSKREEHQYALF